MVGDNELQPGIKRPDIPIRRQYLYLVRISYKEETRAFQLPRKTYYILWRRPHLKTTQLYLPAPTVAFRFLNRAVILISRYIHCSRRLDNLIPSSAAGSGVPNYE